MTKTDSNLQQDSTATARAPVDDNKEISVDEMRRLLEQGRELQRILEPRLRAMKVPL